MPVFKRTILTDGFAGWVMIVSFEYNGTRADYIYEIGEGTLPERQAAAVAERMGIERRAQMHFLRDVHLETIH
ncbi:MAG: hypothetical protein IVW54_22920 [Candidatus Binataceae bacterium]|nr:hypothetical protein [Candidatus Binataceae bacterium]